MEYIISENKLEQLKNKFLTSYVNDRNVLKFDTFIVVANEDGDEFELEEPYFEYDYSDGRLFVNRDVRNNFTNIFGYTKEKSNDFFKNWFENKFQVEIAFVD